MQDACRLRQRSRRESAYPVYRGERLVCRGARRRTQTGSPRLYRGDIVRFRLGERSLSTPNEILNLSARLVLGHGFHEQVSSAVTIESVQRNREVGENLLYARQRERLLHSA